MASDPHDLRWLNIQGPLVRLTKGSPLTPLWRLCATAPAFLANVDNLHDPHDPRYAAHVFPVRTLAVDPNTIPLPLPHKPTTNFQRPRLITAQVIAGRPDQHQQASDRFELVAPPGGTGIWVGNPVSPAPAAFWTVANPPDPADPPVAPDLPDPPRAPVFTPVLLEPLTTKQTWVSQTTDIALPDMRLAAGNIAIRLDPARSDPVLRALERPFSDHLDPVFELTPSGIIVGGTMSLPGGTPLFGRFLLTGTDAPDGGPLTLTLITNGPWTSAWREEWARVLPPANSGALHFWLAARTTGAPPAFEWTLRHHPSANIYVLDDDKVSVAKDDLTVRFQGSKVATGGPDGVVLLRGGRPSLSSRDGSGLVITIDASNPDNETSKYEIAYQYHESPTEAPSETLKVTGRDWLPAATDEPALAARLRNAQGLPAPAPFGPGGEPVDLDPAPPVLFAFTPSADGWLQWPVPNLPPYDPDDDAGDEVPPPPVNTLDGFVRFSSAATLPFSSGDQGVTAVLPTAPGWAVAIEAAKGFFVTIDVAAPGPGRQASLVSGDITFQQPTLRFDGVLWISEDRPDAFEALPRPGAGTGSLTDITLRVEPTNVANSTDTLGMRLRDIEIALPRASLGTAASGSGGPFGLTVDLTWRNDAAPLQRLLSRPGFAERFRAIAGFLGADIPAPPPTDAARAQRAAAAEETLASLTARIVSTTAGVAQLEDRMRRLTDPTGDIAGSLGFDLRARKLAVQDGLDQSRKALARAQLAPPALLPPNPDPPPVRPRVVAWRRHPTLPLAASMPMTRAAAGTSRPLESRDLAPFSLSVPADAGETALVRLVWSSSFGAAAIGNGHSYLPLAAWPGPGTHVSPLTGAPDGPEHGIAFAALGVPGVELSPTQSGTAWGGQTVAYRLDIPALDEAFATTVVPPSLVPAGTDGAPLAPEPAPEPAATATEPLSLRALWDRQVRLRQIGLVRDSYAFSFTGLTAAGNDVTFDGLLAARGWPITAQFTNTGTGAAAIPLGTLSIAARAVPGQPPPTVTPLSGNQALGGLSGSATLSSDAALTVAINDTSGPVPIVGWSAGTYLDANDASLSIDQGGFAIGSAAWVAGEPWSRPVIGPAAPKVVWMLTTMSGAAQLGGEPGVSFWCKDVPLTSTNDLSPSGGPKVWTFSRLEEPGVDTDAWSAASLASDGFEWRVWRASDRATDGGWYFWGYYLTPRQLLEVRFADKDGVPGGSPIRVRLLLSLSLSDRGSSVATNGQSVVLTFTGSGDGKLALLNASTPDGAQLECHDSIAFSLGEATSEDPAKGHKRAVVLTGTPDVAGEALCLKDVTLALRSFGHAISVTFPRLPPTAAGPPTPIVWTLSAPATGPTASGSADKGTALLQVTRAALTLSQQSPPKLQITAEVTIRPRGTTAPVVRHVVGSGIIQILNAEFKAQTDGQRSAPPNDRDARAIVLASNASPQQGDLLMGLALEGSGSGMLAVALLQNAEARQPTNPPATIPQAMIPPATNPPAAGVPAALPIACGHVEFIVEPNPSKKLFGVRVVISGDTVTGWTCEIELRGGGTRTSAIRWPKATQGPDATPPNGLRTLTIETGQSPQHAASHSVTVQLDGQAIPVEALDYNGGWHIARPVLFAAVVDHVLAWPDASRLTWRSLDTIRLGTIPPPHTTPSDVTTFAARYQAGVPGGGDVDHGFATFMVHPGVGRVEAVLQGIESERFARAAATQRRVSGLALFGWFIGMLPREAIGDVVTSPVVRLPWLTPLADRSAGDDLAVFTQDAEPTITLAWPDLSDDVPKIQMRDMIVLGGTDSRSIALSLAADSGLAMPVEQAFRASAPPLTPAVNECFWPSALPSVAGLWPGQEDTPPRRVSASVSVVALNQDMTPVPGPGVVLVAIGTAKAADDTGVASVAAANTLISGELTLATDAWPLGAATVSTVRQRAVSIVCERHTQPLFAVVRTTGKHGAEFTIVTLPAPLAAPASQSIRPGQWPVFDSARRGWARDPGISPPLPGWITPSQTGGTRPQHHVASGLAGLTTQTNFPAMADEGAQSLDVPALTWISDTVNLPWLPLPLRKLHSPPVPWLTPAPSRVRLPVPNEVVGAMQIALAATARSQAFVPPDEAHLSTGARAGVLTVRRTALLGVLPSDANFDPEIPRFGRPAQAGPSVPVRIRTPRPLILPENRGDPLFDRRVQAGYAQWADNCAFFRGPADAVSGDETDFRWTIFARIGNRCDGIVSSRWDGSVAVVFRMVLRTKDTTPPAEPAMFIWQRLFGGGQASGAIWIGGRDFPFRSVRLQPPRTPTPPSWTKLLEPYQRTFSAEVEMVFDPRPVEALGAPGPGPGPALTAIADAAASAVPIGLAEVRLTLQVDRGDHDVPFQDPAPCSVPAGNKLPNGTRRPPVTLRLMLSVIQPDRASLPLRPLSVVFSDPAYDRALAGPPARAASVIAGLSGAAGERWLSVLYTDNSDYAPGDTIALMVDVIKEVPPDAPWTTLPAATVINLTLSFTLFPGAGGHRDLSMLGQRLVLLPLAAPALLDLGTLTEIDGVTPARLAAGDKLTLRATADHWGAASHGFAVDLEVGLVEKSRLEPPMSLYAAMLLVRKTAIPVPLHARSPLPSRVDFGDLRGDFRAGLIRRRAVFSWMTARAAEDLKHLGAFVMKSERNGQCLLPDARSPDGRPNLFVPLMDEFADPVDRGN